MSGQIIDMHMHVGLPGDEHPEWGGFSEEYRKKLIFDIFLIYARLKEKNVKDNKIIEKTLKTIDAATKIYKVVCLALDPVYSKKGDRCEKSSYMWVDNNYIIKLRNEFPGKILFGASVHPYAKDFKERVSYCVENGAVLLKWVPSSQQIFMGDEQVRDALAFLATAKNGKPLPLLLHTGMEYAIPTSKFKTQSNDFLCWNTWDKIANFFRFKNKWKAPDLANVHANLKSGLDKGAVIIFTHCGLPYYMPSLLKGLFEHSDFDVVRKYLIEYPPDIPGCGCCYADVSACATPFRKSYFEDIMDLPPQSLLFGSDFPTPVFELNADFKEMWRDFKAVLKGKIERIIIPQHNMLNVNYEVLSHFFGKDHPMFTNFNKLL